MTNNWQDPFIDTRSGCLINSLNISDQKDLDIAEGALSIIRSHELYRTPLGNKDFDLKHLQAIHQYIFQDVYPWGGVVRDFNLQKGGTVFAPPQIIHQGSDYLFKQLSQEKHLQGLDMARFSNQAGYYLGEINHLHPFREGNGRTQRAFISQLAHQNNYYIFWSKVTSTEMTQASIASNQGDHSLMAKLIKENIQDTEYHLLVKEYASKGKAQIEYAEAGGNDQCKIIGITERYLVQQLADSPENIILHNKRYLVKEVKQASNQSLEISYPHGKAGLVREHDKGMAEAINKQRTIDKGKDHTLSESEYLSNDEK
jgi:cell filamentation protein